MNDHRCEGCTYHARSVPSDRLCRETGRAIPPACAYRSVPDWCPLASPGPSLREARLVALLRLVVERVEEPHHEWLRVLIAQELPPASEAPEAPHDEAAL